MARGDGEAGSYREVVPGFPLLLVSDDIVQVYDDQDHFRGLVERSSGVAGWAAVRLFDPLLREFRVSELRLARRRGFFDWFRRINLEALRFSVVAEAVPIEAVKSAVSSSIDRGESFWENTLTDVSALKARVLAADTFAMLCAAISAP